MMRAGLKLWMGVKVVTVLVAAHLIYLGSSQFKALGLNFIKIRAPEPLIRAYESSASSAAGPVFDATRISDPSVALADVSLSLPPPAARAPLSWAIFTPPKPFSKSTAQYAALRSWQNLRIPPRVYLVAADDLDRQEMAAVDKEFGTTTVRGKMNADGLLQQDALFEMASRETDVDVVVVLNSDIMLGDDFVDALEFTEQKFDRFLLIGARYDSLEIEDIPRDAGPLWLKDFRARTLEKGALHTYGGSDYFAWRPRGDPVMAAIGGRIPCFTYGRGKADNWIIDMAIENGKMEVIDASTAVVALHPAHGYAIKKNEAPAPPPPAAILPPPAAEGTDKADGKDKEVFPPTGHDGQRQLAASSGGGYVNYWSANSGGEPYADFNKYLAYSFGGYLNSEGTPLHAPWTLMRCYDPETAEESPCLRRRQRPMACPCEHSAFVSRTLTDTTLDGTNRICGKQTKTLTQEFPEDFSFSMLIKQRAEDDTVILIGFNYGYQDMLLNMICRMQQLNINNYVIAAFDGDAFAFCQRSVLPCFAVHYDTHPGDQQAAAAAAPAPATEPAPTKGKGKDKDKNGVFSSSAQSFGTKGFRALTKLKSQQVLRILRLGYNVMWSDVDIFWKVNPIPGMLEEMGDMDIGIQSNAPPDEPNDNGRRRINSGFYYVRQSEATVEAFQQITEHARKSTLSEQPSFYTILCGDQLQYVSGPRDCLNTEIPVKTRLLSRKIYPNGAMTEVIHGVTPDSPDKVAIVHFNWLEGHENKVQSFVNASMWMLGESGECRYDLGHKRQQLTRL